MSRISQMMGPVRTTMRMRQVESPDIDDRISYIMEEIDEGKRDPRIRKLASDALTGKKQDGSWAVEEKDWNAEVDAIFYFVRKNVRYTRDIQDIELFQKAGRTLELKIGDCDDLSILLGSMLQAVGYPVILRVIGLNGGTYQHIYVVAGLPPHDPKEWKPLDASRPEGPGWEIKEGVTLQTDYLVE